jgi:hypothetical protein
MKTNTVILAFMLVACLFTFSNSNAQQSASSSAIEKASSANQLVTAYAFKVFQAPDKMYGYDISMNNKIILHQPAASPKQDNAALVLTKKEQAEKAASFMISKMKNNQPATLTKDEIKQLNAAK